MIRALGPCAAVLLLASLLVGVSARPAGASHGDTFVHWRHNYAPPVSANCDDFGGKLCGATASAEGFWVANAIANGFRGGNPFHGCMSVRGWITVCAAPRAVVGGFGVANPRYVQNPTVPPRRHARPDLQRLRPAVHG